MSAHQDRVSLKGGNWLESVLKTKAQPQTMEGSCQRKGTQASNKERTGQGASEAKSASWQTVGMEVTDTQPIFVLSCLPFIKSRIHPKEPVTEEPLSY